MTKDQALQMALDALTHIQRCIPMGGFAQIHYDSATWQQIDDAITAIEQAMQEPAKQFHDWAVAEHAKVETSTQQAMQEPKRPQNCGTGFCSCIECVMDAEPAQEPVAQIRCWMKNGDRHAELVDWQFPGIEALGEGEHMLYAAPQARQPLTFPQLDAAVAAWFGSHPNSEDYIERMRCAIEAAISTTAPQQAMQEPDERMRFESWIKSNGGDLRTFGTGKNIHYHNSSVNSSWDGWRHRARLAAATQQAMQEQEPLQATYDSIIDHRQYVVELVQAMREQAQEPFGIWHEADDPDESDFFLWKDAGDVSCEKCVKLYTAPQARQPLTLEQIDRCIEAADTNWADAFVPVQWARHFAKAVEAAHRIKGGSQ